MSDNKFVHIRTLEKYHPGYKDRELKWAKIYFNMVQGDPDCEMIEDEVDFARLIKFIILELQAKKPIPINETYLSKKGFNLKKRSISLTLDMLHNFVDVVTELSKDCVLDKIREEKEEDKIREEKEEIYVKTETTLAQWNSFAKQTNLTTIIKLTDKRKDAIKNRYEEKEFDFDKILKMISGSEFLKGNNNTGWKVDFDFIFCSKNNYLKILEGKYNGSNKGTRKRYEYESGDGEEFKVIQ
jgi:hypothetical protein